ncbi:MULTISPECIES: DUF4435 domain-containing protein [unclassified Pseudomonas]|uniref:DUF4435 domain-containing protein n=1 Tax=unclassified Pseudomonas TaxID=196821 RepID=UPI0013144835|nr:MULTISPECIES: DUF4435 domain-containing protein [unclassified Pseudomonas]MDW3714692.1 DUF4435 domain-containing protein [Pseudomonas sp. 2023EL-01195]
MRKYIDSTDKKNEIRLLFKHPLYKDKFIVVVEGFSDVKLFRKLFEAKSVELESVDGKKELLRVMQELSLEFPTRVLGICDADYDHLSGVASSYEGYGVYVTDLHDAEMMMLSSPALSSFVDEYTSSTYLSMSREQMFGSVIKGGSVIGVLRWLNSEHDLGLRFKGLNYSVFCFVNEFDVEVDKNRLIDELIKRSKDISAHVTKEFILREFDIFSKKEACNYQVCCGHDVANIVALVYRQKNISTETNMDYRKVEASLRLSYGMQYFMSTKLCRHVADKLRVFSGADFLGGAI